MILRTSFDLGDEADIMADGKELVTTTDMGAAVVNEMAALSR